MQNRLFGKNLIQVVFSRLVSLASSVFAGFLLPKMLSVTDYGLYKVFTLYAVYTALLHFGFVDGLLLKIAGKEYEELEPTKMRAYTRFFIAFEILISLVMVIMGLVLAKGEFLFITLMLAANMVFVNITTYYQFISQAIQRFGEYSFKNLLVSVAKVLFISALFALYFYDLSDVSYRAYLIGLNVIDFSVMTWYVVFYRDITFGTKVPLKTIKSDIFSIFKTGIFLTLAYQVSHLILALDRQFVNVLFSTEVFAAYSFAYNIVSLISTMISSISIVLLPMLKKGSRDFVVTSYKSSAAVVSIAASVGLLCYFPLAKFIEWFLPKYQESITYIAVVLPALLFTSLITVVMFTVTKVLDMNVVFFKDSCLVLVLGVVANVIAFLAFRSPKAISYASLFVMATWFFISDLRLKNKIKVGMLKEFGYLIVISIGFLVITACVHHYLAGFFVYAVWLLTWVIIFYMATIKKAARAIAQRFGRH